MNNEKNDTHDFLLLELQNGHDGAFDYIFRKYFKGLCAQANLYVNDLDKAQSLVQDCFVKLWVNRENACSIKNLPAYLSFMVRNQCVDYLRKNKSLENLHRKAEKERAETNSEDYIFEREFEEKLIVVLSVLPERSRMAFEYSRFENLTYKEIAEKMSISVKAVEALVSRALKTLRIELKEHLSYLAILLSCTIF
ncbi:MULTISPECIES: RNA polymerase sigma-70 factor [unclassified Saccharicrinis]|uniref:RNA polymerase sigma-70 factor n=1 Tax=unclassified Saccharicrinis TaxID=2646859 RepID=UPI003D34C7E4